MAKELVHGLPKTRPYGIVEAAFSVQVDMDNGGMKNPSFYAHLWGWSRTKVKNFLRSGQSNHTCNPKSAQNQVKVRFIKGIGNGKVTTKSEQEQIKDKAKSTTIQPNPNPDPFKNINTPPPKEADSRVMDIFKHWNSQSIIVHRESEKFESHIRSRLEKYSMQEITEAISNYGAILRGEEFFFKYRWGLDDFLSRKGGLDKFLTSNDPFNNFRKKNAAQKSERLKISQTFQGGDVEYDAN